MNILLAPHNDDESLFAAYTIMREHPLVIIVTDSYRQMKRGENITPDDRRAETIAAMKILGAPVMFLGIHDDELTEEELTMRLCWLVPDMVYAPALQGGNPDHDIVARVAMRLWGTKLMRYSTYAYHDLLPGGNEPVILSENEKRIKEKALACYVSQIRINKHHFDAVLNKPEYYR